MVQLRDKDVGAGALVEMARRLLPATHAAGARLIVNDRADVAAAAGADGVHLGPDDLPVAEVRAFARTGFIIGYSTDDPDEAREAEEAGANYLGCGAVYETATKDVGAEAIGLERLDQVARAVRIPVVAIGGVTPERATEVATTAAAGTAVVGGVMTAGNPEEVVRALMAPFER